VHVQKVSSPRQGAPWWTPHHVRPTYSMGPNEELLEMLPSYLWNLVLQLLGREAW